MALLDVFERAVVVILIHATEVFGDLVPISALWVETLLTVGYFFFARFLGGSAIKRVEVSLAVLRSSWGSWVENLQFRVGIVRFTGC